MNRHSVKASRFVRFFLLLFVFLILGILNPSQSSTVFANPALTLTKTLNETDQGEIEKSPGDKVVFEMFVENIGSSSAFDAVIEAKVSEGLDDAGVLNTLWVRLSDANGNITAIEPTPAPYVSAVTYEDSELWVTPGKTPGSFAHISDSDKANLDTDSNGSLFGIRLPNADDFRAPAATLLDSRAPAATPAPDGIFRRATWDFTGIEIPAGGSLHMAYEVQVDASAEPGWKLFNAGLVQAYYAEPLAQNASQPLYGPSNTDQETVSIAMAGGLKQSVDKQAVRLGDMLTYTVELPTNEDGEPVGATNRFHSLVVTSNLPLGQRLVSTTAVSIAPDGTERPMAHTFVGNPGEMKFEDLLPGYRLRLEMQAFVREPQNDVREEPTNYTNLVEYKFKLADDPTGEAVPWVQGGSGFSDVAMLLEPTINLINGDVRLVGAAEQEKPKDQAVLGDLIGYNLTYVNLGTGSGFNPRLRATLDQGLEGATLYNLAFKGQLISLPAPIAGSLAADQDGPDGTRVWEWNLEAILGEALYGDATLADLDQKIVWEKGETLALGLFFTIGTEANLPPGEAVYAVIRVTTTARPVPLILDGQLDAKGQVLVPPVDLYVSQNLPKDKLEVTALRPSLMTGIAGGPDIKVFPGDRIELKLRADLPAVTYKDFALTNLLSSGWRLGGLELKDVTAVTKANGGALQAGDIQVKQDAQTGAFRFEFGDLKSSGGSDAGLTLVIILEAEDDIQTGVTLQNQATLHFSDRQGGEKVQSQDEDQDIVSVTVAERPINTGLAASVDTNKAQPGELITYSFVLPQDAQGAAAGASFDMHHISLNTGLAATSQVLEARAFIQNGEQNTPVALVQNTEVAGVLAYDLPLLNRGDSLLVEVDLRVGTTPPSTGEQIARFTYGRTPDKAQAIIEGGSVNVPAVDIQVPGLALVSVGMSSPSGVALNAMQRGDVVAMTARFENEGDLQLFNAATAIRLDPAFTNMQLVKAYVEGDALNVSGLVPTLSRTDTPKGELVTASFALADLLADKVWLPGEVIEVVFHATISPAAPVNPGQILTLTPFATATPEPEFFPATPNDEPLSTATGVVAQQEIVMGYPEISAKLADGQASTIVPGETLDLQIDLWTPHLLLTDLVIRNVVGDGWTLRDVVIENADGFLVIDPNNPDGPGRPLTIDDLMIVQLPETGEVLISLPSISVQQVDAQLSLILQFYPTLDVVDGSTFENDLSFGLTDGQGETYIDEAIPDPQSPTGELPTVTVDASTPTFDLDLAISETTPGPYVADGDIRFVATLINTGTVAAYDPVVSFALPDGLDDMQVDPVFATLERVASDLDVAPRDHSFALNAETKRLVWTAPVGTRLDVGQSYRLVLTLRLDADLPAAHAFTVSATLETVNSQSAGLWDPSLIRTYEINEEDSVVFTTDPVTASFFKSANVDQVRLGDTLTYSLTFPTNAEGTATPAQTLIKGLRITDQLPEGLEFVRVDASIGYVATSPENLNANVAADGLVDLRFADIPVGQAARLEIQAKVLDTEATRAGINLENTASLTYDVGAGVEAIAPLASNPVSTQVLSCQTSEDCLHLVMAISEGVRDPATGLMKVSFALRGTNIGPLVLNPATLRLPFVQQLLDQGVNSAELIQDSLTVSLAADPNAAVHGPSFLGANANFNGRSGQEEIREALLNNPSNTLLDVEATRLSPGAVVEVRFDALIDAGDAKGLSATAFMWSELNDGRVIEVESRPVTSLDDENANPDNTDPNAPTGGTSIGLPALGVAKQLVSLVKTGGGYFEATYAVHLENMGTVNLSGFRLIDPLVPLFKAGGVTPGSIRVLKQPEIKRFPAGPDSVLAMTPNTAGFNGGASQNEAGLIVGADLIDPTKDSHMSPGDRVEVRFTVGFLTTSLGKVANTANVFAVTPGGAGVFDESVSGSNPDPDGDQNAGNNTGATFFEIEPTGVVYDSSTRLALAGAKIQVTDAQGRLLPDGCLAPNQQNQITDATGRYRIDVAVGANTSCPSRGSDYRINVVPPRTHVFTSVLVPPRVERFDVAACEAPEGVFEVTLDGDTNQCFVATAFDSAFFAAVDIKTIVEELPYFLDFRAASGDPDVVRNHIPLDPAAVAGQILLTKTAGRAQVARGDMVPYELAVANTGTGSTSAATGITIADTPPMGFQLVAGSSFITNGGSRLAVEPTQANGRLEWRIDSGQTDAAQQSIAAGQTLTVSYSLIAGLQADIGRYTNRAQVQNTAGGDLVSNVAEASVEVGMDAVLDCPEILGKVYTDTNRNGKQDAGETGLGGVRLATVDGRVIATDAAGRYHIACPMLPNADRGSNFVVKLDAATLPLGYTTLARNPQIVQLSRGKSSQLNFAIAPAQVVTINVDARAFAAGSARINPDLRRALAPLWRQLQTFGTGTERPLVRVVYNRGPNEPLELANRRGQNLTRFVHLHWNGGWQGFSGGVWKRSAPQNRGINRYHLSRQALELELIDRVNGVTYRVFGDGREAKFANAAVKRRFQPLGRNELVRVSTEDGRTLANARSGGLRVGNDQDFAAADGRNGNFDTFMVGLADLTFSLTEDTANTSNDRLYTLDGQAAFYYKGRVRGDVLITAMADYQTSGEGTSLGNLLDNMNSTDPRSVLANLNPDQLYPVYGDQSTLQHDAPTQGRLYLRVEKNANSLVFGDMETDLNEFTYVRVNRTTQGLKGHLESQGQTTFGEARNQITAFADAPKQMRGTDILRGTGGSLYYLQQRDVLPNSLALNLEIRDKISDRLIHRKAMVSGQDFSFNAFSGRILLSRPLASTVGDEDLFATGVNASGDTLVGHAAYLVATYAYDASSSSHDFMDRLNLGGQASSWVTDSLQVGIAATRDHNTSQATIQDRNRIAGQITYRPHAETELRIELAQSTGTPAGRSASNDGGYSFTTLPSVSSSGTANAVSIDFETDLRALNPTPGTKATAYLRAFDGGFTQIEGASSNSVSGSVAVETTKWGGALETQISERTNLILSYDASNVETQAGTSNESSRLAANVEMRLDNAIDLNFGVAQETSNQANDFTRVAGRVDYNLDRNKGTRVYAFANLGFANNNGSNAHRYGLGARLSLAERLLVGAEVSHGTGTGSAGDAAAKLEAQYDWANLGTVYSSYNIGQSGKGDLVFGAKRRIGDNLNVFGEERLKHEGSQIRGTTTATGLSYTPSDVWRLAVSGEAGQIDGLERRAASVQLGYREKMIQAQAGAEYRRDVDANGFERRTNLYRAKADVALSGGFSLGAHARVSDSTPSPATAPESHFSEASLGLAYRPIDSSRTNAIARYTRLRDLRHAPAVSGQSTGTAYQQKAHLFSVDATHQINPWLTLGGKYGVKVGEQNNGVNGNSLWFQNQVQLAVLRGDFHFLNKWDALLEGRMLRLKQGDLRETQYGGVAGLYRHFGENTRIGVGYNFADFDDNLANPERGRKGAFLNVLGRF